jgi:hypothetical protein
MTVTHGGDHKDRFISVIRARNLCMCLYGQEELRHYCEKCTILDFDENSNLVGKFSVVVTNGVTVGHPCCAEHNCHEPLLNNQDRFCQQHLSLSNICSIIRCERAMIPSTKTCDLASHQAVEKAYTVRGQSHFQLLDRLRRAQISNPLNSIPEDTGETPDPDEEDFEASEAPEESAKPTQPSRKLHTRFGRKQTHNEQLIVAPCGIILSRETFYGAEGPATVVVCLTVV